MATKILKLIFVMLICTLTACTSTKYVPVETVRTEWRERTVERVDTLLSFIHDSIDVDRGGDTIRITRWRTVTKERIKEVTVTDTVVKNDTIREPYPVEKSLTKWEKIKQDAGGFAIGAFLFSLLVFVIYMFYIRKRIKS